MGRERGVTPKGESEGLEECDGSGLSNRSSQGRARCERQQAQAGGRKDSEHAGERELHVDLRGCGDG